jgi:phosphate-selective porin OprO/OprP
LVVPSLWLAAPQDSVEKRLDAVEQELKALKEAKGAAPKLGEGDLRLFWNNGLRYESGDKGIQGRLGVRFQLDGIAGETNDDLHAAGKEIENGAAFRRIRLYTQATVGEMFEFKLQLDFADTNKVKAADVWGEVKKIPVVDHLRVGQFWEPLTLEQNTSDFDGDFGDRSLMNTLSPARNLGAAFHDDYGVGAAQSLTWWLGAFFDDGSGDVGSAQGDGDNAITGRIAFTPLLKDDGKTVIHVGASGSYRMPIAETVSYSAKPHSHLAPAFAATGNINGVDTVTLVGAELMAQQGPFHASAEWLRSSLDADAAQDPVFRGMYVSAGWFLTGENYGYSKVDGVLTACKVLRPYGKDGGHGAFELVANVSTIDLSDGAVNGGEMVDYLFGVNWLLNQNYKVMLDVVHSRVRGVGDADFLEWWFQVSF